MSFFKKLKLNIPTEEAESSPASHKRKRGRPRKHPAKEAVSEGAEREEAVEAKRESAKAPEEQKSEGELTIDVYETDGELVIQSPVAGIKPEDVEISVEDDMLIIRGDRPAPDPEEREKTIMQECYWGPFSRRFVLPAEVDGKIKASLERGILTIRMPKAKTDRKKKVVVEEVEE